MINSTDFEPVIRKCAPEDLDKIMKLQETKKDLADNIINGDNVGIGSMSKDDIMELLGV